MYKVSNSIKSQKPAFSNFLEMKTGDIGVLSNYGGGLDGHYIIRTYSGWVDLNDPSHTWSGVSPNNGVTPVPKGTVITLMVEE